MEQNEREPQSMFSSISTVNSFNGTSSGNLENKFSRMKKLVSAIEMYLKARSEDQVVTINQHLQALSLSLDLSIFDPHTNIGGKFYINVYDLMNTLEPRSITTWYCVDVLLNACKNSSARLALVRNYQFLTYLARMVDDLLSTEKKARLLHLMQYITCGIKIYWQIPHMTHLMSVLCKWISNQDSDIVALSLGVLVNLCHKNPSAIYVLQRSIDMKKFVRMCLALKGPIVEVYVCQVSIILEDMSGYVPGVVLPKFMESTFTAVTEACNKRDNIVLQQIVSFCMEYAKHKGAQLSSFVNHGECVDEILTLFESSKQNSGDPECLSVILDFINFLIEAKLPQISHLFPKILAVALKWLQDSTVSYHALAVLKTIAMNVDKKDSNLLEPLVASIRVFLLMLNSCRDSGKMANAENIKRLGALLQLLTAMIQVKTISNKVAQELDENIFTNIFSPLLGDDSPQLGEITCDTDSIDVYVYALHLVSKLVNCNNSWMRFLNDLLENREIHVIIAQAICHSPCEVKKVALELGNSCRDGVSVALSNLLNAMSTGRNSSSHASGPHITNDVSFNFVPLEQQQRLDNVLENIENLIAKNELQNVAISNLMELFNCKNSILAQAERAASSSLEAATQYNTHLHHRIIRLEHENNRLLLSEFHNVQKLEEMSAKKEEIILDMQNKFEAEKGRHKVLHSQFVKQETRLEQCEAALKDTDSKYTKLQELFNKVQENCERHEKNEQRKEKQLKKAEETIQNYAMQVKALEQSLEENRNTLEATTQMLRVKSAIVDNIAKMANSQATM